MAVRRNSRNKALMADLDNRAKEVKLQEQEYKDPKSNNNPGLIEDYILSLANPYDNAEYKAGQMLLSYPGIESYIIYNPVRVTTPLSSRMASQSRLGAFTFAPILGLVFIAIF